MSRPSRLRATRRRDASLGEVDGRRLLALRLLRQEEAGFEVGEPRRHHQVVRRQFEPVAARLLDEGEVLVRQRKHRNAVKIDLLAAGEFEQQVQRPGKTVDIDDQRWLGIALLDPGGILEIELVRHDVP